MKARRSIAAATERERGPSGTAEGFCRRHGAPGRISAVLLHGLPVRPKLRQRSEPSNRWHGPTLRSSIALVPGVANSYRIFISAPAACSGFPMRPASIFLPRSHRRSRSKVRTVSPFESQERERRDQVASALRLATRLTPALFSKVVAGARTWFADARAGEPG